MKDSTIKSMESPDELSKDERSCIAYLEACAVEHGGLLESIRMNADDFEAIERFKAQGLIEFGRVPGKMLGTGSRPWTHWVNFNPEGWKLAHAVRIKRAERRGSFRQAVDKWHADRAVG